MYLHQHLHRQETDGKGKTMDGERRMAQRIHQGVARRKRERHRHVCLLPQSSGGMGRDVRMAAEHRPDEHQGRQTPHSGHKPHSICRGQQERGTLQTQV